mmetsp:Transcript_5745/g.9747  ORF Transcript_5745/g.9747 Transcript_5745/m.9747 type:complete len:557 (+) Transcript_5745:76-1746(+)
MRWHLFTGQALLLILTTSAKKIRLPPNPFLGHSSFVNPARQKEYDASIETADGQVKMNLEIMRNTSSAYWVDTKAKISGNTPETAEGILASASSKSPPELVVLVWYNLPNRDCDGQAQNVEICCTANSDGSCNYADVSDCADGLEEYKSNYVDPFIHLLEKYTGLLPVVIVVEPNSLTNLVTNLGNPNCANEATQNAYKMGTKYALEQLIAKTEATIYIDAGHGGWLGLEDTTVQFMNLLKELELPLHGVRGFSTDVSGYQPLGIMCPWEPDSTYRNGFCLGGKNKDDPCCRDPCSSLDKHPGNNELNYAQQVHMAAKGILEMTAHIIIDTGRNGVEDMRTDCAEWCNIRGAGAGVLPTSDVPNPDIIDAYAWLKPPGESDGCTLILPNDQTCSRFENMCASQVSIGSEPDEPRAPETGKWFDYQAKQLAANARFTLPPAPSSRESAPPPVVQGVSEDVTGPGHGGPSGGKCCWGAGCDACTAVGGSCDESQKNCESDCGGNWCAATASSFLQSRHLRGLSDVRKAVLLQGSSDIRSVEKLMLEDEASREGPSDEL